MANTIKHKRGSGSDPSASDLVAGELAIRTDTGVVFTKKDDGTVAQIAGGGDTDLGVSTTTTAVTVTSSTGNNATISEASSSAAGVMSAAHHDKLDGIATGAEVNVATNLSKTTTTTTNVIASSTGTNVTLNEATGSAAGLMSTTHHDKLDGIASGATANSTESIQDIVGGMVSGNSESGISVTYQDSDGTLDFSVTSQTDNNFTTTLKNKLDGIESNATADQTAAEIRTLVESASDSNVFTDADHSKLNGIESNATADQTASEILTAIKTVDGASSGLDADLLDGQHGSHYLDYNNFSNTPTIPTNNNQLTNGAGYITSTLSNEQVQDIVGAMVSGNSESGISVTYQDSDGTLDFSVSSQTDNNFTTALKNKLDGIASGATNVTNNNQLTNGAGYITATLTNEQVQDIVGGMVTGNTETGITVTYQDSDGTLDFVVGDVSATVADGCVYENSQTISNNYTVGTNKNAMSAGPITVNASVTVTIPSGSTYTIV